jgi:cytidylate kinase
VRKGDEAMSVITISREFGSDGDAIAHRVAQRLDYHFVDKKFIGHVLGQYGYVEFDKEYETLPGFWERFNAQRGKQREVIVQMLNRVIEAVAQHGNVVILGRSGFEVLGRFADVLHVRVQAPLGVRIGRIMEKHNISFDQAEEMVKENDKVRLAFVEEFYKVPWKTVDVFDLVINTVKIPSELAVDWIVEAVQNRMLEYEISTAPVSSDIVVDHILAEAISETFDCQIFHHKQVW